MNNKFSTLFMCGCICLALCVLLACPAAYAGDNGCTPVTFTNNSDEDIFVGIWHGGSEGLKAKTGYAPPANFPDWKLPKGESRDWCVPQGFSGRLIARTGCNEKGKCIAGDCCKDPQGGSACMHNVCTGGNDSGSVAEFTLDNWHSPDADKWATWYDPSFVDGYNFPIKIDFETKEGVTCKSLGCESIGRCPWNGGELVDGVCLSPYKKYELEHPDYVKRQAYYVLAAKCAQNQAGVCGCGNQCRKDNYTPCPNDYNVTPSVNIKSAGCSPLAVKKGVYDNTPGNYLDELAKAQVTCASLDDASAEQCKFLWDNYDKDARQYINAIKPTCPDAYTWQYDDHSGLQSCRTAAIKKIKITFYQRPQGLNLKSMRLAQANSITGTVKISNKVDASYGYSLSFSAKKDTDPKGTEDIVKIKVKTGDTVAVTDNCGIATASRTCIMSYDEKVGLIPEGTVLRDGKFIPNPDNSDEAKKADVNCYGPGSGYSWSEQRPDFLAMGLGDGVCAGGPSYMTLSPNPGLKGTIKVNNGGALSFSGPTAAKFEVKKGDAVVVSDNRGDGGENYTRSCTMKYGEYDGNKIGLIPAGTVFKNGKFIPTPDDPNDAKNAKKECYAVECSGYRWDRQTSSLPMEKPNADKCKDEEETNFTLYPGADTEGSYQITTKDGVKGETKTYKTGTPFIRININDFDKLTLATKCNLDGKPDPEGTKLSCTMIYDAKKGDGGFQVPTDDAVCADNRVSNIQWYGGSTEAELHFGSPVKKTSNGRCIK